MQKSVLKRAPGLGTAVVEGVGIEGESIIVAARPRGAAPRRPVCGRRCNGYDALPTGIAAHRSPCSPLSLLAINAPSNKLLRQPAFRNSLRILLLAEYCELPSEQAEKHSSTYNKYDNEHRKRR